MITPKSVSVVIPAKNEAGAIEGVIQRLRNALSDAEIIVVDDGSTDGTGQIARNNGASVVTNPYSMGNGAAVKIGARHAMGDILVFMDGDGQHDPAAIPGLLRLLESGFSMAVGARDNRSQASVGRSLANGFYNRLATYMTGQRVEDLTSGFRAVRAIQFRDFIYLLPNGFSYPTTVTMAFFRAGLPVAYTPITASRRVGKSHINPLRDGVRFLIIIFKIGTLYSPLKLFVPIAAAQAGLGLAYYGYTFFSAGRLSLATIFMLTAGVTTFLIGLISEQITALLYRNR